MSASTLLYERLHGHQRFEYNTMCINEILKKG